jgi:acyl-CoA reductase-like NAD-dependent aldehyde dehydrogenase
MSDLSTRISEAMYEAVENADPLLDDELGIMTEAALAVVRNPSDEDVERAAKAAFNNFTGGDGLKWSSISPDLRGVWLSDTDAAIRAYLGGDE